MQIPREYRINALCFREIWSHSSHFQTEYGYVIDFSTKKKIIEDGIKLHKNFIADDNYTPIDGIKNKLETIYSLAKRGNICLNIGSIKQPKIGSLIVKEIDSGINIYSSTLFGNFWKQTFEAGTYQIIIGNVSGGDICSIVIDKNCEGIYFAAFLLHSLVLQGWDKFWPISRKHWDCQEQASHYWLSITRNSVYFNLRNWCSIYKKIW